MKKKVVAIGALALSLFSSVVFASPMTCKVNVEACTQNGETESFPSVLVCEGDLVAGRCVVGDVDAVVVMMPLNVDGQNCLSVHVTKADGETLVDEAIVPVDGTANIPVGKSAALSVSSRLLLSE